MHRLRCVFQSVVLRLYLHKHTNRDTEGLAEVMRIGKTQIILCCCSTAVIHTINNHQKNMLTLGKFLQYLYSVS